MPLGYTRGHQHSPPVSWGRLFYLLAINESRVAWLPRMCRLLDGAEETEPRHV